MKNVKFSVLMSVYYKENPQFLKESLESVFNQTLKATEVILVEDGKLTKELDNVIKNFEKKYKIFKVIKFAENRGLGFALNDGLKCCNYDLVFRMDSDDICAKDRFERQYYYMENHPNIDVLGSNIYEFKNNVNEKMRLKKMPRGEKINSYILKRNPINHMTACFRKSSVLECGSYEPMMYLEDYYLWVKMFVKGKKIDNLDEELVYARIGNGFEKRRGNKKQIKSWKKLQLYMLNNKLITKKMYYINILNMYFMVFCPTSIRKLVYKYILRTN